MQKILMIDDEKDYLSLLVDTFSFKNWQVTSCESALKALQLVESEKFDCILSDINMPEMNGIEFICRVRVGDLNRKTIVVAMSGFYSQEEVSSKAGFTISSFLHKPFEYDDFKQLFDKMLIQQESFDIQEEDEADDLNILNEN